MSQPKHISQDAAPTLSSLRCERWRDGRNRRGWAGETAAAVSHHGEWSGCLHRRVTEHDPQAEVRDCPFPVSSCHTFVCLYLCWVHCSTQVSGIIAMMEGCWPQWDLGNCSQRCHELWFVNMVPVHCDLDVVSCVLYHCFLLVKSEVLMLSAVSCMTG